MVYNSISDIFVLFLSHFNSVFPTHLLTNAQEANCDRARMEEKYRADTAVANSQREFDMRKAGFQEEVNQKVGGE